ncbi:MAG: hypothetical protein EXX96DRAFT_589972 [Benjaminiella poitrasii]|nr:MAG: hypothetical protein EXX96DRAFT_589972 [Benjaminiella poitrasii]
MSKLTIFHNPSCSKCRNSLIYLKSNQTETNYDLDIVEYKKEAPSSETLMILCEYLGLTEKDASTKPWDYILRPEAQGKAESFEEAFQMIQDNPVFLERPFVIDWDRKLAALGRPDMSGIEKLVSERM